MHAVGAPPPVTLRSPSSWTAPKSPSTDRDKGDVAPSSRTWSPSNRLSLRPGHRRGQWLECSVHDTADGEDREPQTFFRLWVIPQPGQERRVRRPLVVVHAPFSV